MLYWALVFLVIALIAGALGFGGIAGAARGIAHIIFYVFLVLSLGFVDYAFRQRLRTLGLSINHQP